mmetsp:Transcript_63705/g.136953  ORF Transcript_63705/g.136953 Transcript_63705/m.136953 type:complete len:205 (+) Transcript_63705:339-953(+)
MGAMAAEHAVRPLVRVVHLLIMTLWAGEGPTTAGEAQPSVAFGKVLAAALLRQRLAGPDAQLTLVAARLLKLPPCVEMLALLLCYLAPVRNTLAQQLCTFHGEVQLGKTSRTLRSPSVSGANIACNDGIVAFAARGLHVATEQLRGVTTYPEDMRERWAAAKADARGHSNGKLLFADKAWCLGGARLACADAARAAGCAGGTGG